MGMWRKYPSLFCGLGKNEGFLYLDTFSVECCVSKQTILDRNYPCLSLSVPADNSPTTFILFDLFQHSRAGLIILLITT